jgi:phenylacetic acid degradation operon negative regulatory protein
MTQPSAQLIPRSPSLAPLRPRSMLFTLYGDYAFPSRRDIWLVSLVGIGQALGLSEVAVRSAVARLAREGWIAARRSGNRSHYGLSDAGRRLIDEGTRRIYRPPRGTWDGNWCILNYSIPEARRAERDRIRKQLAWLGFGPMGGGAYVSPRSVADAAQGMIKQHGVHEFARVFDGRLAGPGSDLDLVSQCWDLPAIERRYEEFIAHYEPLLRRDRQLCGRNALADVDAFVTRFALTHDFRRFPFIDPDLPDELLPQNWAGTRARRLFEEYHDLLRDGALRYFDRVAGGDE